MSESNGGTTPPRGTLTGSTDDLTKDEKAFVEEHLAKGDDVHVIPTGAGRTPDFSVSITILTPEGQVNWSRN